MSQSLTFSTWNILIEGWKTGAKPCLANVDWGTRREQIVQRVVRMNTDVVCFQEVDRFDSLAERMAQLGYYGVRAKRNNHEEESCALFYKNTEVTVEPRDTYYFNDGTGRMIQQVVVKKGNNAPVTVLNTHLINGKTDLAKRTAEMGALVERAKEASKDGKAILVCGDLNVNSQELNYLAGFISNGFIDSFASSPNANKPTVSFEGTHQEMGAQTMQRRIDFVFSKNMNCQESDVRGNPGNLNNTQEPSDHLAILCKYAFPNAQLNALATQIEQGGAVAAMQTISTLSNHKEIEAVLAKALREYAASHGS